MASESSAQFSKFLTVRLQIRKLKKKQSTVKNDKEMIFDEKENLSQWKNRNNSHDLKQVEYGQKESINKCQTWEVEQKTRETHFFQGHPLCNILEQ